MHVLSNIRTLATGAVIAAALALSTIAGTSASAAPAQQEAGIQGDLTNAVLSCYVDTFAFDQLRPNRCSSGWRPGRATNPTVAWFQVTGQAAGTYSFAWTDLETGAAVCANGPGCSRPIATDTSGDGFASLSVRVTDTATGISKTVSAQAEYFDAWS